MAAIVWIASYPRSGNTWTRLFLHNLLNILEGREAAQDINAMGRRTTWEIGAHWFEGLTEKPIADASRDDIARVRAAAQERIAAATEGLLFVKTHNALVAARGMPVINTTVTAGAIYVVRNPLDVAISFARHFDITVDAAIVSLGRKNLETPTTEKGVYEVYGSWSQNVSTWTRKAHRALHVMRYEDMLADPQAAFGALARHLLLEPSAAQLERAIALSSFEASQRQEAEKGFRERPKQSPSFFRAGRAGQWRELLSTGQVARIIADHGTEMRRFGYDGDAG